MLDLALDGWSPADSDSAVARKLLERPLSYYSVASEQHSDDTNNTYVVLTRDNASPSTAWIIKALAVHLHRDPASRTYQLRDVAVPTVALGEYALVHFGADPDRFRRTTGSAGARVNPNSALIEDRLRHADPERYRIHSWANVANDATWVLLHDAAPEAADRPYLLQVETPAADGIGHATTEESFSSPQAAQQRIDEIPPPAPFKPRPYRSAPTPAAPPPPPRVQAALARSAPSPARQADVEPAWTPDATPSPARRPAR